MWRVLSTLTMFRGRPTFALASASVDLDPAVVAEPPEVAEPAAPEKPITTRDRSPNGSRARRWAMRPRRAIVKVHRWLALALTLWVIVIGITGAWLVSHDAFESWMHRDRYDHTAGDVGADEAFEAGLAAFPDGASAYGVTMPDNGRGVYQVYGEGAIPDDAPGGFEPNYYTAYVDPGTGTVNEVRNESEGATNWLYRGHMYLWQDHGIAGVFEADGWCGVNADGAEPGGVKGVACDVIPNGDDMISWFALAWIIVLLTGFYLWYWPGVRRWATAFVIRRGRGGFTFNMSVHKVVGVVVWLPLVVVAFTGAAFAFPNMAKWFQNATPAQRDFEMWATAEEPVSGPADGRDPIGLAAAAEAITDRFPDRTVNYIQQAEGDEGVYTAWVSRGFDPWTREGGAGNTFVVVDQFSGEVLNDETPEAGNVFDQAWQDWSFPLHTGDFAGTWSRVVWVAIGLSPLVLAVTGVVMNLERRKKRKQRATRSTALAAAHGVAAAGG